jgi:hypothetical protein
MLYNAFTSSSPHVVNSSYYSTSCLRVYHVCSPTTEKIYSMTEEEATLLILRMSLSCFLSTRILYPVAPLSFFLLRLIHVPQLETKIVCPTRRKGGARDQCSLAFMMIDETDESGWMETWRK